MTKYDELYQQMEQMGKIIEMLSRQAGLKGDAKMAVRTELASYMMYLSASDGKITRQEAEAIREVCRVDMSLHDVAGFINENDIYSEDFERKVPTTFRVAVASDSAMLNNGQTTRDQLISTAMIGIYQAVGEALVRSDGNVTQGEVRDYNIYINMLRNYQAANL